MSRLNTHRHTYIQTCEYRARIRIRNISDVTNNSSPVSPYPYLIFEAFLPQVLFPRQTSPTNILTILRRQRRYKCRKDWASHYNLLHLTLSSIPPVSMTTWKSWTVMGQPWWRRAVAPPCQTASQAPATLSSSSSLLTTLLQRLGGVLSGGQWHQNQVSEWVQTMCLKIISLQIFRWYSSLFILRLWVWWMGFMDHLLCTLRWNQNEKERCWALSGAS